MHYHSRLVLSDAMPLGEPSHECLERVLREFYVDRRPSAVMYRVGSGAAFCASAAAGRRWSRASAPKSGRVWASEALRCRWYRFRAATLSGESFEGTVVQQIDVPSDERSRVPAAPSGRSAMRRFGEEIVRFLVMERIIRRRWRRRRWRRRWEEWRWR